MVKLLLYILIGSKWSFFVELVLSSVSSKLRVGEDDEEAILNAILTYLVSCFCLAQLLNF